MIHYLALESHTPLQLGDGSSLLNHQHEYYMCCSGLDSEQGVVVLVFSNVTRALMMVSQMQLDQVAAPLLLVSHSQDKDDRLVLKAVTQVRRSVLLKATHHHDNHPLLTLTAFRPFNSPQQHFISKTVRDPDDLRLADMFEERFGDFKGLELQVASWIDDFPFLYYDSGGRVQGISKVMLDEIAGRLHFNYSLQEMPPDGYWGEVVNGTWMGLAGQVVRGEKDIIVDGFAILHDRYLAMDFSVPYFTDSYTAALKVPPPVPRWMAVMFPFRWVVWMGVAAILFLLALILPVFTARCSCSLHTYCSDVVVAGLWLGQSLVEQTVTRLPGGIGTRPLVAAWWLAGLVLSTSYRGSIIAFLTVPIQTPRLTTLSQLVDTDYKLYMLNYGAFLPGLLRTSADPVYQSLGRRLQLLHSYDVIKDRVEAGHAFVEATQYTQALLVNWGMGDVYTVKEKMFPNYNAWAFHKDTPWRHLFNRYLVRMVEAGLVNSWYKKTLSYFRRDNGLVADITMHGGGITLSPLSLHETQGTFLLVGLVLGLAMVTLALEIIFHRRATGRSDIKTETDKTISSHQHFRISAQ